MILLFLKKLVSFIVGLLFIYFAIFFVAANILQSERSLTDRLINVSVAPGSEGYSLSRFRDVNAAKNVDVLFLGSSHTYRSFDPRIFAEHGLRAFNLGSTSQSPINTYYLLKKYYPELNPKIIIMELYWEVMENDDGLESFYDIAVNAPISLPITEMAIAAKNPVAINFLVATVIQRLTHPLDRIQQKEYRGETYIPGGYVESSKYLDYNKTQFGKKRVIKISGIQIDYLKHIIEYAVKNGAKVMLVTQPVPRELLETVENYPEVLAEYNKVASLYGVKYYDYNLILELDTRKHYRDKDHLNWQGVRVFNSAILDSLRQDGHIK